jgi:pimeloyl-ACP methyl ester carboxylesterase
MPTLAMPRVVHGHVEVNGLRIFNREAEAYEGAPHPAPAARLPVGLAPVQKAHGCTHSNVELYPQWQAWLREHQPPTLVVWGRGDPFFVEAGAEAFKDDVPDAEVHVFDAGHFALEDRVGEIAPLIGSFLERTWSPAGPVAPDESSRAGTMSPRSRSTG